jgi:hypothetical protein
MRQINKSDTAVSEVLGTILLLGIVSGLFSIVSISFVSFLPDSFPPTTNIVCQVDNHNITLIHLSGDALSLDTKIGFSKFNGSTQYITVKDYLNTSEIIDGKWGIGEKIVYSNSDLLSPQIQVTVIDPSSNSMLLSTTVPVKQIITVTTLDATDITLYSANLHMNYDFLTKSGSVRFIIHSNDEEWINSSWVTKSGSGSYNSVFSSLSPLQVYYFKAQLLYNSTIVEGEEKTFITGCPAINTSVNHINPYTVTSNPLLITAISSSDLDNVTLYYRWSNDNSSWTGESNEIYNGVDSNTSNLDSSPDAGLETNFLNVKGTSRDGNSMTLQEADSAGQTHKTAVQGNSGNVDDSSNKGIVTNFANAQGTTRDGNSMTLQEADSAGQTHHKTAVQGNSGNVDGSSDKGTETNFANAQGITRDTNVMTLQETTYSIANEHLYAQTCTNTSIGWTWSGGSTPLNAIDGNTISTSSNGANRQWFNVDNTASTGDDLVVSLSIYVTACDGGDYISWGIDTTGDNTNEYSGTITPTSTGKWFNSRTITGLTTGVDVNASRISLTYKKSGSANTLTIDACQLNITRTVNYQVDLEYNWSTANFSDTTKFLCFYVTSHTGSENLNINYRNGGTWTNLGTITGAGWINVTATGLTNKTYTIQLIGTTETNDTLQDSWNIDCIFLHSYNTSNYQIDFEYNWLKANFSETTENVSIYVTSHTGTEKLKINYWKGSTWEPLGEITTTGWSNFTAKDLSSSVYTIQLIGGTESNDINQDLWNIDCVFLYSYNVSNYQINLEYQWTNSVYNRQNKQICLYIASHIGTEKLKINDWRGSTWEPLGEITTTGWSNFTAKDLSSSVYTIQLIGGTESTDTTQDSWTIDVLMLDTWNNTGSSQSQNWTIWNNPNNPDTFPVWSWHFDFPKGTGYYEFYSIGKDIDNCVNISEAPPVNADTRCHKI